MVSWLSNDILFSWFLTRNLLLWMFLMNFSSTHTNKGYCDCFLFLRKWYLIYSSFGREQHWLLVVTCIPWWFIIWWSVSVGRVFTVLMRNSIKKSKHCSVKVEEESLLGVYIPHINYYMYTIWNDISIDHVPQKGSSFEMSNLFLT